MDQFLFCVSAWAQEGEEDRSGAYSSCIVHVRMLISHFMIVNALRACVTCASENRYSSLVMYPCKWMFAHVQIAGGGCI